MQNELQMYQFSMILNHYMKSYRHFTYIMVYYKSARKQFEQLYLFIHFFLHIVTENNNNKKIHEKTCIKTKDVYVLTYFFMLTIVALSDRSLVQTWVLCSCFTAIWQLMSEELFLNYFCVQMYQRSSLLSSLLQKDLPTHTQTAVRGYNRISSALFSFRYYSILFFHSLNQLQQYHEQRKGFLVHVHTRYYMGLRRYFVLVLTDFFPRSFFFLQRK